MHFFSFKLREEAEKIYLCPGDLIIFGETEERAPDGTPMCVVVGSAMDPLSVSVTMQVAMQLPQHQHVKRFFAYTKGEIREGLNLAAQEERAGDN